VAVAVVHYTMVVLAVAVLSLLTLALSPHQLQVHQHLSGTVYTFTVAEALHSDGTLCRNS
jgi:hypothetical protein